MSDEVSSLNNSTSSGVLVELSDALGMSKNALLEKLLSDEYERQSELIQKYNELKALRKQ